MYCKNCRYSIATYQGKTCPVCDSKNITNSNDPKDYQNNKISTKNGIILAVTVGMISLIALSASMNSNSTEDKSQPNDEMTGLGDLILKDNVKITENKIPTVQDNEQKQGFFSIFDNDVKTIHIKTIPDVPNKTIPQEAVQKAFLAWSIKNPDLKFEFIDSTYADIVIDWQVVESPTHVGLATCGYHCILEISLGTHNCRNQYIQADVDMVTNTIMHEIGHAYGLEHHSNQSHLMYGDDEFTKFNFKTLGLNIPQALEQNYVGQLDLIEQFDALEKQYFIKDAQFESILNNFGITVEQYDSGTVVPRSNALAMQINPVIEDMNSLVDRMDVVGNQLDCYPNFDYLEY